MPSLSNPVPSAMTPSPRVAVVGPGAVGAFLAAHLVAAGVEVVACARRPFDRYVIESEQYPADEPATVITDPSSAVPADVVLVCVKVTQTGSIAPWLAALCGPHTLTVSVQNGLESADLLASVVPAGTVLPSVVYVGVQLVAPGHVRHTTAARLVVPDSDDGRRAAQVFTGSAVTADLVSDFRTEVWRKLGVNAAVNGITAITGRTTEVYSRPDAARLARDLLRECWSIARLDGAMLTTEQADSTAHNLSVRPIGAGTSMLYDRLAGAPTEHDAIYGAIVRAAERLGSDAPLARTLDTLLAAGDPS